MNTRGRSFCRWLLVWGLVPLVPAQAAWEFSKAGDVERRWEVSIPVSGGYDDNVNTTASDKHGSFTVNFSPAVTVNLPFEQASLQLRYEYGANAYEQSPGVETVDQSHSFDAVVTHNFSPRLNSSLTETFRFGIEPELVEQVAGVPLVTRRRGDYLYNDVSGNLDYELTPRWNLSLGASWDRWRYAEASEALLNDHDDYGTTVSAIHSLDPRSFIGANYQILFTDYTSSETNNNRNSTSHTIYLSYTRRFNPRLSLQLNPGFQVQQLSQGNQNIAPWVSTSISYVAGAHSLTTVGFSYYLSTTDVSGYQSSANAVMYWNTQYQPSPKVRFGLGFSYTISTFQSPSLTAASSLVDQQEDSWHIGLTCGYNFTTWAALTASYEFSQVSTDIGGRGFERNRVSLGATLRY